MRLELGHLAGSCLLLAAAACHDATSPTGPPATPALTTAADLSGRVTRVTYEGGDGPAGPYSQYDVWVAVRGSAVANAGVVVPAKGPVYVRGGGGITYAATPGDLRAGDAVEVWHDRTAAYGAVQGPPGAPTYIATQVVITR